MTGPSPASALPAIKRRSRPVAPRRPVVAVIGSGLRADPCCGELGRRLAAAGYHLLTGAGGGVMAAVSRAFHETSPRAGLVLGIVPGSVRGLERLEDRTATSATYEPPAGYPNPWVELPVYTHLPDSGERGTLRSSRNHVNVLSADAVVALPGSAGTAAEVWLALRYGVPIVAFGDHGGAPPHDVAVAPSMDAVMTFVAAAVG